MLENINKNILFTNEECKGKYLDLHDNYNEFINIKNINDVIITGTKITKM